MEVKIRKANNGFILEGHGHDNATLVFEFGDGKEECEAFRELANTLSDSFGLFGGRHDDKRFYGIIAPGDKHEDFQDYHSYAIFGADDGEV